MAKLVRLLWLFNIISHVEVDERRNHEENDEGFTTHQETAAERKKELEYEKAQPTNAAT